jgi:hypothetical protein
VRWWPPTRRPRTHEWLDGAPAAPRSLARALGELAKLPRLGRGTFVFVVSDFLDGPPDEEAWWRLLARGWDPVPVLVQDPVWEQSFPAVGGVTLPVAGADGSHARLARVSHSEAVALREEHETRLRITLDRLRALTLEPICVDTAERAAVQAAFARWALGRGGRLR